MFKKLASDVMGLSDIGTIVPPEQYGSVDSDDYVLHEDGEKIFFLIRSKSDEYCFTNQALIHLDGNSAMDKRRMLKRYTYKDNHISHVRLETAGNIDRDVEIKFELGNNSYSIDVDKNQIEKLKDLYKALIKIGSIQDENNRLLSLANESILTTSETLRGSSRSNASHEEFTAINEYSFNWRKEAFDKYLRSDFGDVFLLFINN
ncbi:PH domain-containing protein [Limibacter armeniacum]|uniref:PH domain-containing protein n=1 Tax=Limibacter armeniacum TaxID=466084 RepID=UPI002FE604E7